MASYVRRYLSDDEILNLILMPRLMEAARLLSAKLFSKGQNISTLNCVRALEELRYQYL